MYLGLRKLLIRSGSVGVDVSIVSYSTELVVFGGRWLLLMMEK